MISRVAVPIALVSVLACLGLPSPARGEYLRFEIGDATANGVPASFEELLERVDDLGMVVNWQEPPTYDPYFAAAGGATYGSLTCTWARGVDVTLSWIRFDDVAIGAAYEQELVLGYGTTGYLRWLRSGHVMVQVYSLSGAPEPAVDVLERIVGG